MGELFKFPFHFFNGLNLRQKMGLFTIVLAWAFMFGWVRSHFFYDGVSLTTTHGIGPHRICTEYIAKWTNCEPRFLMLPRPTRFKCGSFVSTLPVDSSFFRSMLGITYLGIMS
jgi:hypothetical protein